MDDLLEEMFYGKCRFDESGDRIPPALKNAYRAFDEQIALILEQLDDETRARVDELLDLRGLILLEEACNAYAEGVRFGVRLMAEVYTRE